MNYGLPYDGIVADCFGLLGSPGRTVQLHVALPCGIERILKAASCCSTCLLNGACTARWFSPHYGAFAVSTPACTSIWVCSSTDANGGKNHCVGGGLMMFGCKRSTKLERIYSVFWLFNSSVSCSCRRKNVWRADCRKATGARACFRSLASTRPTFNKFPPFGPSAWETMGKPTKSET